MTAFGAHSVNGAPANDLARSRCGGVSARAPRFGGRTPSVDVASVTAAASARVRDRVRSNVIPSVGDLWRVRRGAGSKSCLSGKTGRCRAERGTTLEA